MHYIGMGEYGYNIAIILYIIGILAFLFMCFTPDISQDRMQSGSFDGS